jgi:phosphoribosylcarboxyaminoimidazole (NCAIR) mutase
MAIRILGGTDERLSSKLSAFEEEMRDKVAEMNLSVKRVWRPESDR